MREMIQELIQYRHLLFMLTWRDIKIKYKQSSIMGFFWAIFMPMIIVAAGIVVKKAFSILSGNPLNMADISSVAVKSLPWAFFVGSVRFATNSLTSNISLVTKIYFPPGRYVQFLLSYLISLTLLSPQPCLLLYLRLRQSESV